MGSIFAAPKIQTFFEMKEIREIAAAFVRVFMLHPP
jgi:hypothetical protein